MSCPNLGKNAKVALGAVKVARMTSLSITINNENEDVTEFGDDFMKYCQTIGSWNATVEGYYDPTADGQGAGGLHEAALSASEVPTIRLYEDDTVYWGPNTGVANATCFISSWTMNADPSGIVNFTMSLQGSGALHRVPVFS